MERADLATPTRPRREGDTESAGIKDQRPSPDPSHVLVRPSLVGRISLNHSSRDEATDNDPTVSSGTCEAKDARARETDRTGNTKNLKKETKSPWNGFGRRSSSALSGGTFLSTTDEPRSSMSRTKASTRLSGRLSILSSSTSTLGTRSYETTYDQGRDCNDPAAIHVHDASNNRSDTSATTRVGHGGTKLTNRTSLEASEIQPGAVRVRGIHRTEGDESSSKFEDDLDFYPRARGEQGARRTTNGEANASVGDLSVSLEPLSDVESGAFSTSSTMMATDCNVEGGHNSMTSTVTASAVSREELELELRDQILREAVVAHVSVDDAAGVKNDDLRKVMRQRRCRIALALAILATAGIAVGIIVSVLSGNNKGNGDGRQWTPEQLKAFIINEMGSSQGFEMEGFSPSKSSLELIIDGGVFDNVTLGAQIMDAFVIMALWAGTGGSEKWTRNDGWNENPDPCTWFGIGCNARGRVSKISLPGNNLEGPLNPDLRYFSDQLTHLDVSDNQVGLFRFNLTFLPNLEYLNFSKNTNNGFTIGDVTNYNLVRLQVLDISSNLLTGPISTQIAQLTSLRVLHLQSNALTGTIPTEIASLKNLVSLQLENNELTGNVSLGVCSIVEDPLQGLRISVDCSSVNCTCCECGAR